MMSLHSSQTSRAVGISELHAFAAGTTSYDQDHGQSACKGQAKCTDHWVPTPHARDICWLAVNYTPAPVSDAILCATKLPRLHMNLAGFHGA
jgi:hypothetical protein